MNYRDTRAAREKELRRIKFIVFCALASFFLLLSVISFFIPAESWQYRFALPKVSRRGEGELRIHYLDVGQADSAIIEFPDGKSMLIDAGDTHSDSRIIRRLNALKIKKLDYLLITHTDADHCGSAAEVVKFKGVKKVLLPQIEDNSNYKTAYKEFLELIEDKGIEQATVKRFDQITSSNEKYQYAFTVLFPHGVEYDEDEFTTNELSTVSYLQYGETDALFCGDTTAEMLSELIKEDTMGAFKPRAIKLTDVDILKVPHHGGEDALNDSCLNYFNIRSAVISCGLDNIYGHPHEDTLEFLANSSCEIYRTDLQGTVTVTVRPDGAYDINTYKE